MKTILLLLFTILLLFSCSVRDKKGFNIATPQPYTNFNYWKDTFTVAPNAWIKIGSQCYSCSGTEPVNNVDDDIVLMYVSITNNNWCAMPVNAVITNNDEVSSIYQHNRIQLIYYNNLPPAKALRFKLIILSPVFEKPK